MKKIVVLPKYLRGDVYMCYMLIAVIAGCLLLLFTCWDAPILGNMGLILLTCVGICATIVGHYCWETYNSVKKYRADVYYSIMAEELEARRIDLRKPPRFDLRKNISED